MSQYIFKPLSTSFNHTKSLLLLLEMLGKFCSMTFNLEYEEQLVRADCLTCMQLVLVVEVSAPCKAQSICVCKAARLLSHNSNWVQTWGFSLIPRTQYRSRASGQYL